MTPPRAGDDLWSFSLAVYDAPGVAEACLMAQDAHGQDVNLILWAAWLGWRGHLLTPAELDAAQAATAPWREEVVAPLRTLRRRLKTGPLPAPSPTSDALRGQIKAAELEAEHLQQSLLAQMPPITRCDNKPENAFTANLALILPPAIRTAVTEALHAAVRVG
ncbi:TIGR02444 family protein [Niveispirillum irakense]|uniref:TIGR02444 family protein n=1 Tax=Niveispirillum irakense TaxID=34011 RepID=UPI0004015682|nr:TIGR02444 family protein [Niveispirillum irakense]